MKTPMFTAHRSLFTLATLLLLASFAPRAQAVSATGGTVTNYTDAGGTNWTAHIFTNAVGSTSITFSAAGTVEYLIVGGGGSAGGNGGGGGGAGGVRTGTVAVTATTYPIVVGAGATQVVVSGQWRGTNGGNSSVFSVTAVGGGGGASRDGGGAGYSSAGGSGGGGGGGPSPQLTKGSATGGYGNDGGGGYDNGGSSAGGGGGGYGSAGTAGASQQGGNGGNGYWSSLSGVYTGYCGGGAGSGLDYSSYGGKAGTVQAGAGGGGPQNGSRDGRPNSGGGGGGLGTGLNSGDSGGGSGGSGIVIVRYVASAPVLPAIANLAAANITPTSADLRGSLISTGTSDAAVWVYWGTTDQTTNANLWAYTNYFGSGLTNGTYTTNTSFTTSFAKGTKCYYNFYAQNASGGVWAATAAPSASFNTLTNPIVAVSAASGLGVGTATLNGTLASDGGAACAVFFCWGANDLGTSSTNPWNVVYCGTAASGQSFFTNVTGLTYGIRYWYYAYATNAAGDAWSSPTNFLTPLATGGDLSYVTNTLGVYYGVHVFTNTTGTGTLTLSKDLQVDYLVIAGGGGGGGGYNGGNNCGGGGGGAGGYRCSVAGERSGSNSAAEAKVNLSGGVGYVIKVGAGGAGGTTRNPGVNGGNSFISNTVSSVVVVQSTGGGGGGAYNSTAGFNGGSGGGGYAGANGGTGTVAEGYGGGSINQNRCAGGGGGAGAVGLPGINGAGTDAYGNTYTATHGGAGGTGLFSRITGALVQRAGGGGGGCDESNNYRPGYGGAGGGGNGGTPTFSAGQAGSATTGSGGGGGTQASGGSGGSGIVVVRYEIGAPGIWNQPVSAVTTNSATLNGYLVTTGYSDTAVCVLWDTNNAVASGAWANTNWFALNQWGSGSSPFTNLTLTPDRTYYYTYGASNAAANLVATYPTNVVCFITGGVTVDSSGDATAQYPSDMTGTFTISRPASVSAEPLIVTYTTTAGSPTATNGIHYSLSGSSLLSSGTAPTGSVYMAAGVSSVAVSLTPLSQVPANRSAILTLTPGVGNYALGVTTQQTVTLQAESSGTVQFWTGAANSQWNNAANWTNSSGGVGVIPTNLPYSAVINGGANQPVILDLANGPFTIASLTLGQSVASTLTFQNGDVSSKRLIVTGDVLVGPNGTLTHAAETAVGSTVGDENHRLRLDVGGNLTIAAGGQINVNYKGYAGGAGFGKGSDSYAGAGHGGGGGKGFTGSGGTTYGSITNPVNSGSGANLGAGGGTVVLRVTGAITHNGLITANGVGGAVGGTSMNGAASGGSINLMAGSITGGGVIRADGGRNENVTFGGAGGGGRIALVITNAGATIPDSIATNISAATADTTGNAGAGGTIYLMTKGQSYGTLAVDWKNRANISGSPTLLRDATNQFDTIILTNQAIFAVGTNAALNLTGCTLLTPPSAANNITTRLLLGLDNGTVTWPAAWTNNGAISWRSTNTVTIGSSLTVASNAVLTTESGYKLSLALANLTIDNGAWICLDARGSGSLGAPSEGQQGASHGGLGAKGNNAGNSGTTYGSITNPVDFGCAAATGQGGGAAILQVSGALTHNGVITANGAGGGGSGNNGTASGGSINLRVGSITGGGIIRADGGMYANTVWGGQGGGGRIALVVTNVGATIPDSIRTNITAITGYSSTRAGGCGTIYLMTNGQNYGTLIVDSRGYAPVAPASTLISPSVTDTVVGDVRILNSANLTLSNANLTVNGSWSNAVGPTAISGGTVVLAGTSPATVWGGNTWSNLTIATAGKTVQFEAGKTQTVYGLPLFSNNVTLVSTLSSNWWYLRKPGVGTQDVGVVTVRDSNATNGMTFAGAAGSVNGGNNLNWIFRAPKGTVLMVW